MTERKPDSEYSKKYDEKRKAERIPLNLYQDNPTEKAIFENLKKEPNRKQLLVELLKKHYKIGN